MAKAVKQETLQEPNYNDLKVEELLFKQVEKPKNFHTVKITNVFENRYRINIWTRVEEEGLERNKIHTSYFAHLDGDTLNIK